MPAERADVALDEESLRRAQAVVDRLKAHFREWVQDDLDVARQAVRAAAGAAVGDAAPYLAIRRAAHNFKGLGGSFGYDLVTEIGDSLSRLLRHAETVQPRVTEVADAHVAAITRVVDEGLTGDGGDAGRRLLADLAARTESVLAADPSDHALGA